MTVNGNSKHTTPPTPQELQANRFMSLVENVLLTRTQWVNSMMDPRRDMQKECGYPSKSQLSPEYYQEMYDRNPVAARVVEIFPKECWKVQPLVYEDEDPDITTPFEQSWDELGKSLRGIGWHKQESGSRVFNYMARLDEQSGIGQYGVALLGLDDGLDLSQPAAGVEEANSGGTVLSDGSTVTNRYKLTINEEMTQGRKLLYIRVFPHSQARVTSWETNPTSPRYDQPVMYQLTFNDPVSNVGDLGPGQTTRNVHWTRIVHVPSDLTGSSDWLGTSRMSPVVDPLFDIKKILGADGEGYWKNAFAQLFLEMDPEFADTTADIPGLRTMMEAMQNGLQRWGYLQGMRAKTLPPSIVDPTPHLDLHIKVVCIKGGYPKRIFEGSERGELSSGQDSDEWATRVRGRRNEFVTPMLITPFIDRLIMVGVLVAPGEEGYRIEWPQIDSQSDMQKAQIAMTKTSAISQYVSGGCEALIPPLEYMTRFLGYTDEEAIEVLEAAAEQMVEKEAEEIEKQQELIDKGLAPDPTDPAQMQLPPEAGGPPKGPKGPPKKGPPQFAQNVFCPTGAGGGVDPSCGDGDGTGHGEKEPHGYDNTTPGLGGGVKPLEWNLATDPSFDIEVHKDSTDTFKIVKDLNDRDYHLYSKFDTGHVGVWKATSRSIDDLKSKAEKLVKEYTTSQSWDYTENVFCPTGKDGGVDPTCKGNGLDSWKTPDTDRDLSPTKVDISAPKPKAPPKADDPYNLGGYKQKRVETPYETPQWVKDEMAEAERSVAAWIAAGKPKQKDESEPLTIKKVTTPRTVKTKETKVTKLATKIVTAKQKLAKMAADLKAAKADLAAAKKAAKDAAKSKIKAKRSTKAKPFADKGTQASILPPFGEKH